MTNDDVYLTLDSDRSWSSARIVEMSEAPEIIREKNDFRARRVPRHLADAFMQSLESFLPLLAEVQRCPDVRYQPCYSLQEISA